MSDISPEFRQHLSGDVTTLCTIWQLKLKDETVIGMTDHDTSLVVDDVTYVPNKSLNETDQDYRLGFAADGGEIQMIFDLEDLSEDAIKSGALNDAKLTSFAVNWQDPSQFACTSSGRIGRVKISDFGFEAEWIGYASLLERNTGRVFSKMCDASFGDQRCGVDVTQYPSGTTCPRSFVACRDQFSNVVNFRGFPYLLGDDVLQSSPQSGERLDGGSRYRRLIINAR